MKNKFRSVGERWHLRSVNWASITSPSHWPSNGDVWVRACNVWLPQGPSYSMNVVVHIGKQRLYKPRDCHQILTSSRTVRQRQNDDLRFCPACEKCEWWGRRVRAPVNFLKELFAEEETCRDWYRIEHTGRDGGSTSEWPFLQTNLFVMTNSTISFQVFFASWSTSSSFSRSLQQRWPLRSGSAR